jgi:hypothetical protein
VNHSQAYCAEPDDELQHDGFVAETCVLLSTANSDAQVKDVFDTGCNMHDPSEAHSS